MSQSFKKDNCERQDELISFLYGEIDDEKLVDFEEHLQQCHRCESERASFNAIRGSIGAWKQEALNCFAAQVELIPIPNRKKSASAALREFFSLSPLWMKGAVAFSALLFCLLAVFAFVRSPRPEKNVVQKSSDAIYTQQDLENAVRAASQNNAASSTTAKDQIADAGPSQKPRKSPFHVSKKPSQEIGSRRPLTKAEREQLAVDLRLTNKRDENGVDLLGERINY